MTNTIQVGFQAFISDDGEEFGAIRDIARDRCTLTVYVENSGDFVVPIEAVASVHAQKVIFDCGKLGTALRRAIGHAHDAEE